MRSTQSLCGASSIAEAVADLHWQQCAPLPMLVCALEQESAQKGARAHVPDAVLLQRSWGAAAYSRSTMSNLHPPAANRLGRQSSAYPHALLSVLALFPRAARHSVA
jgi:hypothetical protein